MATVLVTATMPGNELQRLSGAGHKVLISDSANGMGHDAIVRALEKNPDIQAIICLLSEKIDEDVLDAGPSLRVIANYAVGYDNLDLQALKSRGIVGTNTPGVLTEATADLTFSLLLDACRNVSRGERLVREGEWTGWAPTLLLGPKPSGATLGLIGFGRIGRAVAKRARGFDMHVLYSEGTRASDDDERLYGVEHVSLDELFARSDIVSVHCPLTPQTRGLLSRERLSSMKKGAVLINTARGACVDEQALIDLLRSGHLHAAGLDVYVTEPNINPEFLSLPNVVLSPHLGSADFSSRVKMCVLCVDSVLAVLSGKIPECRVV